MLFMSAEFQLRWKGKITGPFTKEQIDTLFNSRKIGALHEINYNGKWMLLEAFNVVYEKEAQKLRLEAEARERKKRGERARQEEENRKQTEEEEFERSERQAERKHQREMELLGAEQPPPPLPRAGSSPVINPTQQTSSSGNPSGKAKSGGIGFGVFIAIMLGILWHQGYWDPNDIKALWGDSKYIKHVRNNRFDDGKTLGQTFALEMTGVTWKSSRGDSRDEILVTCSGSRREADETHSIKFVWVVNKREKTYVLESLTVDGEKIKRRDLGW